MKYANEFDEILPTLVENNEIKQRVLSLIKTKPILGKVIEEDSRVNEFREILVELVEEKIINLKVSFTEVESRLPREKSKYSSNNMVFASGWAERLVRTHLSRFYNQAVLEELDEKGEEECFVPASSSQNLSSRCAIIQNKNYKVKGLLQNLINNYDLGKYDKSIKIPEHPHCSHVVRPIEEN